MEREEYLQQEAYRLSRLINIQTWAIGQLKILNEHSNREYAVKQAEEINDRVKEHWNKETKVGDKLRKALFDPTQRNCSEGQPIKETSKDPPPMSDESGKKTPPVTQGEKDVNILHHKMLGKQPEKTLRISPETDKPFGEKIRRGCLKRYGFRCWCSESKCGYEDICKREYENTTDTEKEE